MIMIRIIVVQMNVLMSLMGLMMNTVASAPPPRILELQDGVEAGPEPHPRRSTRTESKYLQGELEKYQFGSTIIIVINK